MGFGVWGLRFVVFGFWFLVFGFWFRVFGFWFLVFGFWFRGSLRLTSGGSEMDLPARDDEDEGNRP